MTAMFEGENHTIFKKPDFLFRDAAPDADQQLLSGEGQWVYTLDGDQYYLRESRCQYPLAFLVRDDTKDNEMGCNSVHRISARRDPDLFESVCEG